MRGMDGDKKDNGAVGRLVKLMDSSTWHVPGCKKKMPVQIGDKKGQNTEAAGTKIFQNSQSKARKLKRRGPKIINKNLLSKIIDNVQMTV